MRTAALAGALMVLAGGASRGGEAAAPELAVIRTEYVAVRDGLGFVGRTTGLAVVDLSAPDGPREEGRLRLRATVHDVALDGERAFLAAGSHGLVVADLRQPRQPTLVSVLDRPGRVSRVAVRGTWVLLAERRHGLTVVDVRDPARPLAAASVGTADEVVALALAGERLATAEGHAGVRLFDVRHPDRPEEIAAIAVEGARDVAWAGMLLLVAAGRGGLVVIDLAEPRHPERRATVPPVGSALAVGAGDGWAVVGNGGRGIQAIDLADPGQPRVVSVTELPGGRPAYRTTLVDRLAYVASDRWGLAIVDLTDAASPVVLLPRERRMRVSFP